MAQKHPGGCRANKSVMVRDKYSPPRGCIGDKEALSTLRDEHSAMLEKLYLMDKQLAFMESSGPILGRIALRELVETGERLHENLQLHMMKEEMCLFPILEPRLGKGRKLVELMRREHVELLASLESLRSELDRMTGDRDTKRTWMVASRLQELRGDLSDHLSRG